MDLMKITALSPELQEQIEAIENESNSTNHSGTLTIPLAAIASDKGGIRTVFNKDNDKVKELIESVREKGILNPISVRRVGDFFVIIDGFHRFSAATEAELTQIPANYFPNVRPQDVPVLQISANYHKIDTRPIDYAKGLLLILANNPTLNQSDVAEMLNVSPTFVNQRLNLNKNLNKNLTEDVNEGRIPLSSAFILARMDDADQMEWAQRAREMPTNEFMVAANSYVLSNKGRKPGAEKDKDSYLTAFTQRTTKEIREYFAVVTNEVISKAKANQITEAETDNIDFANNDFLLGFYNALRWVGRLDPESIAARRAEHEARENERIRKQQEREAQKTAEKVAGQGIGSVLGKNMTQPAETEEQLIAANASN